MLLDVSNIPPPDSTVRYAAVSWVPKVIKSERFTVLALVIITATGVIFGVTITGGGLFVAVIISAAMMLCSSSVIGPCTLIFRNTCIERKPGINNQEEDGSINNDEEDGSINNDEEDGSINNDEEDGSINNDEEEASNTQPSSINNDEEEASNTQPSRYHLLLESSSRGRELRQLSSELYAVEDREALIARLRNNGSCNVESERSLTSPLQDEERKVLVLDLLRETEDNIRESLLLKQIVDMHLDEEPSPCSPFSKATMDQFIDRLLQSAPIDLVIKRVKNLKDPLYYERLGILDRPLRSNERELVLNRLEQSKNEGNRIDLSPGINQDHLLNSLEVRRAAIFIPESCKLDKIHVKSLVDCFKAMNTTRKFYDNGNYQIRAEVRADYIDSKSPNVICYDGKEISYAQVEKNISTLVDQIEQRSQFMGVPTDDRAREQFYTQLETFLKVIIYEIQSKNHQDALCKDIILQLAIAVEYGAQRYISILSEGHRRLTLYTEPQSSENIGVRSLIDCFKAMNTTSKFYDNGNYQIRAEVRADYIDSKSPKVIFDDGEAISYAQVEKNISTLVDQIEQRSQFVGVPTDDRAREQFYTQLEMFLKGIIYEIQSKNHQGSLCKDIILQLAIAVGHDAERYISVLSEGYERLTLYREPHSFEDIVLEEFHAIRNTIVRSLTYNHTMGRANYQPSVLNRHMRHLGPVRGIRYSENLKCKEFPGIQFTEFQSVRAFDKIYTDQYIQQCFDKMVNGVQVIEEDGTSFDLPRFESGDLVIGKPMVSEWLGEHVPLGWKPSIRDATGSIVQLTDDQIEGLFGPGFDDEQKELAKKNSGYQQIIGVDRSQAIRARMFQIACTTTVGNGNIKSVACTYILKQLGVLNSDINCTELYMDIDVLSNFFSYNNDDLNRAHIKF